MRIKTTEIVIEDDDGHEVGHIDGENYFCPDAGTVFDIASLKFILTEMGGMPSKKRKSSVAKNKVRRRSKVVLDYVKQIEAGKYKQITVAEASNVDQGTLSAILTGRTLKPKQEILNKIRLGLKKLAKAA